MLNLTNYRVKCGCGSEPGPVSSKAEALSRYRTHQEQMREEYPNSELRRAMCAAGTLITLSYEEVK